jgi:glycine/D-amino acid oxidase-like deaminating enzyme
MDPRDKLPFPIFSKSYLITRDTSCIVGATFERRFTTEGPDPEYASHDLLRNIEAFAPFYATLPVLACKAGFRATTKNHRPLIARVSTNCFCLTGLGARGLLYHAYMAKQLAQEITL